MDIPLHPEIEQIITRQLQSGRYSTVVEVIHRAVLLLEETNRPNHSGAPDDARKAARRSPRGILSDIRSSLSADDINEARHEAWAGLTRDHL